MILDRDSFTLTSVGVDVGSATTNLVVSRLEYERLDGRYVLRGLVEVHAADPMLTPFAAGSTIDGAAIGRFVQEEYRRAGVTADEVALGAVILTGLALERRNAREVGDALAAAGGRFVSFAAGDDQEASLAAFGSGAVRRSRGADVLNIDIGGGTTKIARCRDGRVEEVTALDVGARLLTHDDGLVLEDRWPVADVGEELGLAVQAGKTVDAAGRREVADRLAGLVVAAASGGDPLVAGRSVLRRQPVRPGPAPDHVVVSGGVSAYLAGERRRFGDLGPELAVAVGSALEAVGWRVTAPDRPGIRCTVMGAAEQTVQVSGPTVSVMAADVLPLQGLHLVKLPLRLAADPAASAAGIQERLCRLLAEKDGEQVAIGVEWNGTADFDAFDAAAHGIAGALERTGRRDDVAVVVCDEDVGHLLGTHLRQAIGHDRLIVVDGIEIRPFTVLDIGVPVQPAGVVPVSIKSLVLAGGTPARLDGGGT